MEENELINTEHNAKSDNIIKAVRAATAVLVFGIPMVAVTISILCYGAAKVYKKIKGKNSE